MANIVAIVGRPNVGKSTLFNRLIEKRRAIMDNESGVTRDRHYGYGEWNGKHFTVVDTGGYVTGSEDKFESAIRTQVKQALSEASVILFMVDCDTGMTDLDKDFANVVREVDKPVIIAANKADTYDRSLMSSEFYAMDWMPISLLFLLRVVRVRVRYWISSSLILKKTMLPIRMKAYRAFLFLEDQTWANHHFSIRCWA